MNVYKMKSKLGRESGEVLPRMSATTNPTVRPHSTEAHTKLTRAIIRPQEVTTHQGIIRLSSIYLTSTHSLLAKHQTRHACLLTLGLSSSFSSIKSPHLDDGISCHLGGGGIEVGAA